MKKWQILQKTKNKKQKTEDIVKILLKNRGLETKKQIKDFLNPPNPHNLKPRTLGISKRELNKAIKRIKKAIDTQESIIVYSDFDTDGICGAAILWETLDSLGAKAMPYIPDRIKEGYGLSKEGINQVLKEYNAGLIITVDLGITACKQVEYAQKKGIDVIVTDHHLLPKKKPSALAVVHTTELSGSAVAWFLAREIERSHSPGVVRQLADPGVGRATDHLALAAIGTIADLVPLVGPSRGIVKYGLEDLNRTKRIGLNALFKEAGLEKGEINTYHVGFIIAPRLNAMGRLEHAIDSLRLLCARHQEKAVSLAKKLDQTNRERQALMRETTEHAKNHLAMEQFDNETMKLIFLSHQSYHEGVIGLVAGKLVKKFYRPAIVVSKGKKHSKASARSINGFNIVEAIRTCSDLLVDCGGHPMAAGFTVETKHLEKLKEKLEALAAQEISEEQLKKTLKIDCLVNLSDLTLKLYERISQLAPFGVGNPTPVFATRGVIVQNARRVGSEEKHLKLSISSEPPPRWQAEASAKAMTPRTVVSVEAIAFNLGHLYPKLSRDKPIDIAYNITLDQWNGRKSLQLKIKDIKLQ